MRSVIVVIAVLCLAGCWDNRLLKDATVVTLAGIEGRIGDLTGYYLYPETIGDAVVTNVVESTGISPRNIRQNAELKVGKNLDLSMISTLLISAGTAEDALYDYLDIYFRDPLHPLTTKLAIVDGDMKALVGAAKEAGIQAGEFYGNYIESLEQISVARPYTIQTASSLFFDVGQDLVLPLLTLNEEIQRPEFIGLALFSGQHYTGVHVDPKQSVLLNLLSEEKGNEARLAYLFEDDVALAIRVLRAKRKIEAQDDEVTVQMTLKITIDEFAIDHLASKERRQQLKQFLEQKIQQDMASIIQTLQQVQCDAIGIGRYVRVYHPSVFQEDWHTRFSSLTIRPNVDVEIIQTGISQ